MTEKIRAGQAADLESLARVYRDSIQAAGGNRYSPEQLAAWSSFADDRAAFSHWLDAAQTFVAVDDSGRCIGFAGLEPGGRIASLFVDPRYQRRRIATRLVQHLLALAASRGLQAVSTEASAYSLPVFEACGFARVATEHTRFKGVAFERYRMRRLLKP